MTKGQMHWRTCAIGQTITFSDARGNTTTKIFLKYKNMKN